MREVEEKLSTPITVNSIVFGWKRMFKRISIDETSSLPESQRVPRDSTKVLRLHSSCANWLRSPEIGGFSKGIPPNHALRNYIS